MQRERPSREYGASCSQVAIKRLFIALRTQALRESALFRTPPVRSLASMVAADLLESQTEPSTALSLCTGTLPHHRPVTVVQLEPLTPKQQQEAKALAALGMRRPSSAIVIKLPSFSSPPSASTHASLSDRSVSSSDDTQENDNTAEMELALVRTRSPAPGHVSPETPAQVSLPRCENTANLHLSSERHNKLRPRSASDVSHRATRRRGGRRGHSVSAAPNISSEAWRGTQLTPLTEKEEFIDLMTPCWRQADDGAAHAIVLAGSQLRADAPAFAPAAQSEQPCCPVTQSAEPRSGSKPQASCDAPYSRTASSALPAASSTVPARGPMPWPSRTQADLRPVNSPREPSRDSGLRPRANTEHSTRTSPHVKSLIESFHQLHQADEGVPVSLPIHTRARTRTVSDDAGENFLARLSRCLQPQAISHEAPPDTQGRLEASQRTIIDLQHKLQVKTAVERELRQQISILDSRNSLLTSDIANATATMKTLQHSFTHSETEIQELRAKLVQLQHLNQQMQAIQCNGHSDAHAGHSRASESHIAVILRRVSAQDSRIADLTRQLRDRSEADHSSLVYNTQSPLSESLASSQDESPCQVNGQGENSDDVEEDATLTHDNEHLVDAPRSPYAPEKAPFMLQARPAYCASSRRSSLQGLPYIVSSHDCN
ncbi:uncharacterized protein L969DRAFT_92264 [Mixia osmundae IAM 14324]|uniref:Uncharacterized protein n=1 Tax=Mixia osmundae (strain CBS 9802 / IAM 14324 / JCM 22182 / KY 12970) TaxID=764103 RepID=G7DTH1_MIXOS|nr:uncharacterized protein L969DRAFT_92264 [Mixia osmundae IAM 14324]KEI42844.1 hypothetical protein L969DRAFT_92264 [Mixia osmundae IAM 14324]GAA93818.1 hypothetical protein E5Q_00464 [Mixia osmundae IAM 14324]